MRDVLVHDGNPLVIDGNDERVAELLGCRAPGEFGAHRLGDPLLHLDVLPLECAFREPRSFERLLGAGQEFRLDGESFRPGGFQPTVGLDQVGPGA